MTRLRRTLVATDPRNPDPTSEAVRRSMQGNRARGTRPEILAQRALRVAGYRGYRLSWLTTAGRIDIAYPGRRVAVLVHGCFWHGCSRHRTVPKTNAAFWSAKIAANRARDRRMRRRLAAAGWSAIEIWECALIADPGLAVSSAVRVLNGTRL
jgi:DNA mismatch endonuclease (patch repair protein)